MRALVLVVLVGLTGVASAAYTFTPSSLTTPATDVGVQSGSVSGTLMQDAGGAPKVDLVVGACTGSGAGSFAISPNANVTVNSPVTIAVTYTPTVAGSRTCTVNVYPAGLTSGVLVSFVIIGSGQDPPMMSVGTVSTFAAVRVFDSAVAPHTSTRTISVTNTGDRQLQITSVTFTGDFSLDPASPTGTSTNINGGQSRQWTIRFNPTAVGTRNGSISFASNVGTQQANLSGDGTSGAMTTSIQSTGNFGTVAGGSSAALDVTLSHTGNNPRGTITISSAMVTPADPAKAWFSLSGVPTTIGAAGGTLTVTCSPPTNSTDTATGTVTFRGDVDGSAGPSFTTTYTHNVSCTAGASLLALSTATVDFGPALIGTTTASQSFTLSNNGNQSSSVSFSSTSANRFYFALATPTQCGLGANPACVIAPAGSLQVTAQFTPNVESNTTAGFSVTSGGPSLGFTLSGRGVDRHLTIAESSYTAPDTYRGALGVVDVPLLNTGEYPIMVSDIVVDGTPVWSIVEPAAPFMIAGLATVQLKVGFRPLADDKAADGQVVILNDDAKLMSGMPRLLFSGNGIARNVDVTPGVVDLGDRAVGVATRFSDVSSDSVVLANNDVVDFVVREVTFQGDHGRDFTAIDRNGDPLDGRVLPASANELLDVVFTPSIEGDIEVFMSVYLDEDTIPQQPVLVRARALTVDINGGGGCSTGQGAGPLALLALVLLRRRRYR